MCGAPGAHDWSNVGSVDLFFTYVEYGFSLKGVSPILDNEYDI